jgi:hypothetical protein
VATRVEATDQRTFSGAIYGVVSVAAVVVAWESDGDPWDLPGLILGYILILWLTHSYAHVAGSGIGGSWRVALRHELPVGAVGFPALAVASIGALMRWDDEPMSDVALIACAVTLVAIQTAVLRSATLSRRRVLMTVIYDLACAALIVFLHIVID